jgi:hypothetical protein
MPEWQERITRETHPAIRIEHELRYAMAAPLIRGASTWVDLGCGAGIAAASVLGDGGPDRAVLVDASEDALAEAAVAIPAGETVTVEADLASADGLAAVRAAVGDARGGCVTCFEVIEHLEAFTGVVDLLIELAEQRDFTALLSVPNDAFWPIESPWHKTMWGEGAFEELRRLLPAEHVVAPQVPLQGSSILPDGAAAALPPEYLSRDDAVPSHFIAAFGPRCGDLRAGAAVAQADLMEQRRWERQREANLAIYEDRIADLERKLSKRRLL